MNITEIETLLRNKYPEGELKKLREGGMSYAYEINHKIIRIPKNEESEKGYEREDAILKCLHKTVDCTSLPDIKIVREPFFHTIHNKIEGIYWNTKQYFLKSEKEKEALADDCALFFTQLHGTEVSKICAVLPEIPPIQEDMEKYLTDYFSPAEMNEILKFTEPLYSLGDKVLIHKDFYEDNFLLSDDYRLKAVLDYGNSGLYNYMYDFKFLGTYSEPGMQDLFKRLAPRYTKYSGRLLDMETIYRVDIHNYINFLAYFSKNKDIKDEKIDAIHHMDLHVGTVKSKIKAYVKQ